jgi:hypothetical protein
MMPADLVYALSSDRQRAALNRARAERIAEHDRRQHARSRRTRERTS